MRDVSLGCNQCGGEADVACGRAAGVFPGRPDQEPGWYRDLRDRVVDALSLVPRRSGAGANRQRLMTYWAIGRDILQRQHTVACGDAVIDQLSADLGRSFPDLGGGSARNLRYMRAFAAAWPNLVILMRGAARLSWSHHQLLLDRLPDAPLRFWYALQAEAGNWSRDFLDRQIARRVHERCG